MKKGSKTPMEGTDHPFLRWYAGFWSVGEARMQGKDILLDGMAATRFGLGVDPDGIPVLGIKVEDRQALLSLSWNSAAFIRNHQGRDWVALSCKDIRIEGAEAEDAFPLRLWVPVPQGVLDAWFDLGAPKIRFRAMKKVKGLPLCAKGPPLKEIPLTKKDRAAA